LSTEEKPMRVYSLVTLLVLAPALAACGAPITTSGEPVTHAASAPMDLPSTGMLVPSPTPAGMTAVRPIFVNETTLTAARRELATVRAQLREALREPYDRGQSPFARWPEGQFDRSRRALVADGYALTIENPNSVIHSLWTAASEPNSVPAPTIIELDIRFSTVDQPAAAGLVFDGQANDGESKRYFLARNDGSWELLTFRDGALDPASSTALPVKTELITSGINRVRVVRQPAYADLWINDTPVGRLEAPSSGGFIGVGAASDDAAPVTVVADNLHVLTR
jgi:hypothetical protein